MKDQLINACCGCEKKVANSTRREILKLCGGIAFGISAGRSLPAYSAEVSDERPEAGDYLVLSDSESSGTPVPLSIDDLKAEGNPIVAVPFNQSTGVIKSGSRLNKVILIRLPIERISQDIVSKSADGVLAYSAVCTHQGCDITTYVPKDDIFFCFCHLSQFRPTTGGDVVAGPAPRRLPMLPLRLEKQKLVVAGKFSSRPGVAT